MTISDQTSFKLEVENAKTLSVGTLAYFRERFKNNLHSEFLSLFLALEKERKITRAELARRIDKEPAQITRYLGAPGNWTIDTVSDLFLAMGYEPKVEYSQLFSKEQAKAKPTVNLLTLKKAAAKSTLFIMKEGITDVTAKKGLREETETPKQTETPKYVSA